MTFSSRGTSLLDADFLARQHDPVYTISASCPLCHRALTLRQAKDGRRFYIACARRPCDYTAAYDKVLVQLRDRIARLEGELAFARMQTRGPIAESLLPEAADVAHKWGVAL